MQVGERINMFQGFPGWVAPGRAKADVPTLQWTHTTSEWFAGSIPIRPIHAVWTLKGLPCPYRFDTRIAAKNASTSENGVRAEPCWILFAESANRL
jgi:hypothetical protein